MNFFFFKFIALYFQLLYMTYIIIEWDMHQNTTELENGKCIIFIRTWKWILIVSYES